MALSVRNHMDAYFLKMGQPWTLHQSNAYGHNHRDDGFSVAHVKPEIEFMDFQYYNTL
jgi:hypothetical protein